MVVAIAAGNSASAAAYNGFGTNLNLTEDPDNGIVSSPVLTSAPPAWPVWRTPG